MEASGAVTLLTLLRTRTDLTRRGGRWCTISNALPEGIFKTLAVRRSRANIFRTSCDSARASQLVLTRRRARFEVQSDGMHSFGMIIRACDVKCEACASHLREEGRTNLGAPLQQLADPREVAVDKTHPPARTNMHSIWRIDPRKMICARWWGFLAGVDLVSLGNPPSYAESRLTNENCIATEALGNLGEDSRI